jgi:AraC family transcriptional regulator, positive regulator of tynA and feaB
MRSLISTSGIASRKKFDVWRDVSYERLVPSEARKIGDSVFEGSLEAADIGGLLITRSTFGTLRTEFTPGSIRRHSKQHTLSVTLRLSGSAATAQHDRALIQKVGDMVVVDRAQPAVLEYPVPTQSLLIEVPRARLEGALGSARNYTVLAFGADRPSTALVNTFFTELVRTHEELLPATAARMASIGVDLIVASIADGLARDVPKSLHGTVIVQRAKAYVEANLGDPALDPPQIAAALGISLRWLQELFQERGQHVADWIWQRRLETAALRLTDPGRAHMAVGTIAYGCGFVSQAHFSRRFRARFGMTPSEYRQAVRAAG